MGSSRFAPLPRPALAHTLLLRVDMSTGQRSSRLACPRLPKRPCPSRCATQESAREIAHPSSIRAQRPTALGGRFGARRPNKGLACRPWVPPRSPNPSVRFCYRGARRNGRRARVGEIASRSTQYLPGAIGHRAAVSEHREPFAGRAGDAAGPSSSATHPASVRTAISGIKQMLYGNFY